MVALSRCLLAVLLWMTPTFALTDVTIPPDAEGFAQPSASLEQDYAFTSRHAVAYDGITLQGAPAHIVRLTGWLDRIFEIPHGRATIESILASGHRLRIRSSDWALQASGRTLAPVTADLINGRGADVEILFDARIPDEGSHWVYGSGNNLIEFTAIQNLYHELAHAKHLTNGTWRYSNSEAQAIQEENIFRRQLSEQQGRTQIAYRVSIRGLQFWHPDAGDEQVAPTD